MAKDNWSGSNPWLGLAAYTEGTPLYGRTKESIQLTEIIKDNMASVVFGKSGIGKSSLLNAGISPLLREDNYIPVHIRFVHNTDVSYVEQIENKVREMLKCHDRLPSNVRELGLWDFFHRHTFFTNEGIDCIPVIILDQFEEIYTITDTEHKNDIIMFFNELSSLLNDVKPDNVIEEERKPSQEQTRSVSTTPMRRIIKRSATPTFNYSSSAALRIVICLREDKLYLLERNSANIPSLKANRYNLHALSSENALEVIMCPQPELFTNEEAIAIIEKLGKIGDEGIRTVDPAILSLYLHENFEKRGTAIFENIFKDYYKNSINSIPESTIKYIEENLISSSGIRYQHPLDSMLSQGIKLKDIDLLVQKNILRKDTHNGIIYVEFIHDILGEVAANNITSRKNSRYKKRNRIILTITFVISLLVSCYYHYRELVLEEQMSNLWIEQLCTETEKIEYYYIQDSIKGKNPDVDSLLAYQHEVKEITREISSFGKNVLNKNKQERSIDECLADMDNYTQLTIRFSNIVKKYLSIKTLSKTRTAKRISDETKISEFLHVQDLYYHFIQKSFDEEKDILMSTNKESAAKKFETIQEKLWRSEELRNYIDGIMGLLKESIIYTNIMIDFELDKNGL